MKILVVHEAAPTALNSAQKDDLEIRLYSGGEAPPNRHHSLIKESDVIFLFGASTEKRLFADDAWHLLRNKHVFSVGIDLGLPELRDLFPLSKVSICSFYFSPKNERALMVLSSDQTVSDHDRQEILGALKDCGDLLFLNDAVHNALDKELQRAASSLSSFLEAIQGDAAVDSDLFGYALGWLLYGLGDLMIRGKTARGAT